MIKIKYMNSVEKSNTRMKNQIQENFNKYNCKFFITSDFTIILTFTIP